MRESRIYTPPGTAATLPRTSEEEAEQEHHKRDNCPRTTQRDKINARNAHPALKRKDQTSLSAPSLQRPSERKSPKLPPEKKEYMPKALRSNCHSRRSASRLCHRPSLCHQQRTRKGYQRSSGLCNRRCQCKQKRDRRRGSHGPQHQRCRGRRLPQPGKPTCKPRIYAPPGTPAKPTSPSLTALSRAPIAMKSSANKDTIREERANTAWKTCGRELMDKQGSPARRLPLNSNHICIPPLSTFAIVAKTAMEDAHCAGLRPVLVSRPGRRQTSIAPRVFTPPRTAATASNHDGE